MKVARATQRQEIDVVNVIEWRDSNRQRWFLLVRRPDTGLLAGLHEFPAAENVSKPPKSLKEAAKISETILSNLLVSIPSPVNFLSGKSTDEALRTVKIQQVGSVLHVFSHIKKTYQVQWVLLKGGGDKPPAFRADVPILDTGKRRQETADANEITFAGVRWLSYDEVSQAKSVP